MRADAQKNYEHLLAVANEVVTEDGADASLREIARRAGVGLGTLHRHFPKREVLLDALLRARFDELAVKAGELNSSPSPGDALLSWLRAAVAVAHEYNGAINSMVAAIADPDSTLHTSCQAMKAAGTHLLVRAQEQGLARPDLNGSDLFGMLGALAWLRDQPALAERVDHLFDVIGGAMLTKPA
jgi:AcrR family transcriptional regulator